MISGLFTGDFMSDSVFYAVKIVASFYKVYSANIYNKRSHLALNMRFVSNFLLCVSAKNWQYRTTSKLSQK